MFPPSMDLRVGLRMDNVTSLLHLYNSYTGRDYMLQYVQDPAYVNFTNSLKIYKGDALVIEGDRLNTASDENDVRVTIGDEYFNITSITTTQVLHIVGSSKYFTRERDFFSSSFFSPTKEN